MIYPKNVDVYVRFAFRVKQFTGKVTLNLFHRVQ
jgi:hypothetical protein